MQVAACQKESAPPGVVLPFMPPSHACLSFSPSCCARIRFFFKNERKQKSRVVYPLTAQQQAYVGQFPTAETLCAALKAAAGAAGGAAAGPAASSTSSALTSTSRSAHGYGVQCIKAAWRSYIYIDNTNCYLPGSHTMAAAQAMRDAAVVCWVRYLHMRG